MLGYKVIKKSVILFLKKCIEYEKLVSSGFISFEILPIILNEASLCQFRKSRNMNTITQQLSSFHDLKSFCWIPMFLWIFTPLKGRAFCERPAANDPRRLKSSPDSFLNCLLEYRFYVNYRLPFNLILSY